LWRIVLLFIVAACGCAKDPFGERAPRHDAVCPAGMLSYQPRDLEQAKQAGCRITFKMEADHHEESAVCCPKPQ
jgi:hypothetical protein